MIRHKLWGVTIIEFTIVSTALLLLTMGVLQVGHYVYSLQVVNDMTRVAARLATVCHVSDKDDIPALALQDNAPSNFTASNLTVEYLDSDGQVVSGSLANDDVFTTIRYVRARVVNYDYQFGGLMSFLGESGVLTIPQYETTLPNENLGIFADTSTTDC